MQEYHVENPKLGLSHVTHMQATEKTGSELHPRVDFFASFPLDLQEEVVQRVCDYGSDWMRKYSTIAQDILSLGLTCKAAHKAQMMGLQHLGKLCPAIRATSLQAGTSKAISDNQWDTFVRSPTELSRDSLVSMTQNLPHTDHPFIRIGNPLTEQDDQLFTKLQCAFGIQTPVNVPAKVLAAVRRERRPECPLIQYRYTYASEECEARKNDGLHRTSEKNDELRKIALLFLSSPPSESAEYFSEMSLISTFKRLGYQTEEEIYAEFKQLQDQTGKSKQVLLDEMHSERHVPPPMHW